MEKQCTSCRKTKDISSFGKHKGYRLGVRAVCNECRRIANKERPKEGRHQEYVRNKQHALDRELFSNYGITREQYNEMIIKQDYLCAICGKHQSESHKGLHTDHCHETKKVRGLLCNSCNLAIGMLKHNVTILTKAIKYLGG